MNYDFEFLYFPPWDFVFQGCFDHISLRCRGSWRVPTRKRGVQLEKGNTIHRSNLSNHAIISTMGISPELCASPISSSTDQPSSPARRHKIEASWWQTEEPMKEQSIISPGQAREERAAVSYHKTRRQGLIRKEQKHT